MQTYEAIDKRVSVREYQKRAISQELLMRLVDAGRKAPTARAVEPWEFVVITERETLEELGRLATSGGFIGDAGGCIAVFCENTKYYLEDGCAATENILLAAADAGLGACWVAGDKKPYANAVSKFLGAPERLKLVSLVSLGWPNKRVIQAKRRTLKEVVHWQRF